MTVSLAHLLDSLRAEAIAAVVVFLRVAAAMAVLPALGERSLPMRLRLVLAVALTALVAPAASAGLPAPAPPSPLRLLLTETVIGLALGLVLRLTVVALQVAGAITAQATSLSQILGATGPEPLPAIGHVMVIAGLALAVTAGLHWRLVEALIGSYAALPAGRLPDASVLSQWGIAGISRAFAFAFSLAAPFVIAGTLYNVALGVINRAMPQLMVAFVGAPAITAGGLALLALSLPELLSLWTGWMLALIDAPYALTGGGP